MTKKIMAMLTILMIASCSTPRFDNNEYMLVAEIKNEALSGMKGCNSNPYKAVEQHGSKIFDRTQLYSLYAERLSDNVESYEMSKELYSITEDLISKGHQVSKFYCKQKFEIIMKGADRIMVSLSAKKKGD